MSLLDVLMGRLAGRLGISRLDSQMDEEKLLVGRMLSNQILQSGLLPTIQDAEFKVFSQFADDGIIQYLIARTRVSPAERTFIEFGVQNYEESNTRFLLFNNSWRGLVLDVEDEAISYILTAPWLWRTRLSAACVRVAVENVNMVFAKHGFVGDIGLLSIDIDGNDYWVWKAVNVVRPVFAVVEYNATFGPNRAVTIPYSPNFDRTKAHFSNLYWGASLKAIVMAAEEKDYAFVGTNSAGNNAYFVRRDRLGGLTELDAQSGFTLACFRESRDRSGSLTYLDESEKLRAIADMPLIDVEDGQHIEVGELLR